MNNSLHKWQYLDAWLYEKMPGDKFTVQDYADAVGITTAEAADHIQAFLTSQRAKKPKVHHTIHRSLGTRTKSATWTVGARLKDAQEIRKTVFDDLRVKMLRQALPDLRKICHSSPAIQRRVENTVEKHLMALMQIIDAELSDHE